MCLGCMRPLDLIPAPHTQTHTMPGAVARNHRFRSSPGNSTVKRLEEREEGHPISSFWFFGTRIKLTISSLPVRCWVKSLAPKLHLKESIFLFFCFFFLKTNQARWSTLAIPATQEVKVRGSQIGGQPGQPREIFVSKLSSRKRAENVYLPCAPWFQPQYQSKKTYQSPMTYSILHIIHGGSSKDQCSEFCNHTTS